MNKLNIILEKHTYLLVISLMSIFISSCSSYKGVNTSEDGIYAQPEKEVVIAKEPNKDSDNFFAKELDKYENLEENDEIILDAEDYSYDEYDEEDVESNAAWGYDTNEVVVTHHVNYNWYHPYHSPYYYGYNWGFYNWFYPSYYYRPWGYQNYGYYGYGSYYGGYYSPYYYGGYGYNPYYYGGYGSYNPYYYGGYGYNAYNHTRPYNQYGRRADYGNRFKNRRSLSRSVANNNVRNAKPSLIRGSGTISERTGRKSLTERKTPTINSKRTGVRRGAPIRDNTSRTRPSVHTTKNNNVERNRTTSPRVHKGNQRRNPPATHRTNTSRKTTPTRRTAPTRNTTTKPNTRKTSKSSYSPPKNSSYSSGRSSSSGSNTRSSNAGSSSSKSSSSSGSRSSSRRGRR